MFPIFILLAQRSFPFSFRSLFCWGVIFEYLYIPNAAAAASNKPIVFRINKGLKFLNDNWLIKISCHNQRSCFLYKLSTLIQIKFAITYNIKRDLSILRRQQY